MVEAARLVRDQAPALPIVWDKTATLFAQDVQGVMLSFHMASRLLADADAADRARRALDTLLTAAA